MSGSIRVLALSGALALSGCAGFVTTNPEKGVEVYRPGLCLMVTDASATAFTCPNLTSTYEIKPRSILARNEFTAELNNGMLTKVTDSLDTASLLTFLQAAAELGAKAAGVAVSEQSLEGSIDLDPGFYFWDGSGALQRLSD